ncbi:MAG TPA: hypothetical protein VIV62_05280 [Chthoniobacterales bacterium]|jgi:hypothetical protein
MLNEILKVIEEFQRTRGRRPQVVCLNPRHMQRFMEECPDLFDPKTAISLGFRIVILPESELTQPKAIWLRRRRNKTPRPPSEKGPELISWADRKHKLAEGS